MLALVQVQPIARSPTACSAAGLSTMAYQQNPGLELKQKSCSIICCQLLKTLPCRDPFGSKKPFRTEFDMQNHAKTGDSLAADRCCPDTGLETGAYQMFHRCCGPGCGWRPPAHHSAAPRICMTETSSQIKYRKHNSCDLNQLMIFMIGTIITYI